MKFDTFGGQTIYYDDARLLEGSPGLENGVDVIVTSPPYNVGKSYSADDGSVCNDSLSAIDYDKLLFEVFTPCFKVMKDDGVFFLNVGDSAKGPSRADKVLKIAEKVGFIHLQTIVWVKSVLGRGQYTASGGTRRLDNVYENIFVMVKDKKKYRLDTHLIGQKYADKSNIGRYGKKDCKDPGNVWLIPYETTGRANKKNHAAPFPVGLPYKCIKAVPGAKVVLDPFAGTGTTLAAAELLGISGVGFELYPRCSVIEDRITNASIPKEQLLVPHLEMAVRLLSLSRDELYKKSSTKKGRQELEILSDVLRSLGVGSGIMKPRFSS